MSACLFPSVGDLEGTDSGPSDAPSADAPEETSTLDAANDAHDALASDAPADVEKESPPPGPIAFVQVVAEEYNAATTAFANLAGVKPHDSIIVLSGFDAQAPITVMDSVGSAYTQLVSFDSTDTGEPVRNFVWAAFDVAGGNVTVTVTTTDTTHEYFEVYALEYAGLSAFDVSATAQGTSSSTDAMASGYATTTFANDLIVGYGTEGVGAAGTSFTLRSGFESDVVEDRIVSTAGAYEATATMVSGSGWEMAMVAFKGF